VNQPQLFMRLPELTDLPAAPPHGPDYALRTAVPADHEQLAELLSEAFGDRWDAERVAAEFSPGNGVEATYVVVSPAGVVATASARRLPDRYPDAGYVHYVGVRIGDRGRRLGEVVTRRVLAHFVAAGLDQAVLETDDFRLPAVRTYLRLGFVPQPQTPGEARRWSRVLRNLTRTGAGAAKAPGTPGHHRSSAARADVMGLSEYVYQRTRGRLTGLTDDEYFWEPVPGCWTIRRTDSGAYRADYADRPAAATSASDPPLTTIAWRLWHLIGCYGGKRNPRWLGVQRPAGGFERDDPAPPTAAEALAIFDRAHAFWQELLQEVPAASWWEPLGPVAGPYAEDDRASLVLHQLDEQIHHGAELGVLRDLYRHGGGQSTRSADDS